MFVQTHNDTTASMATACAADASSCSQKAADLFLALVSVFLLAVRLCQIWVLAFLRRIG